jgi:hypothetical protein
MFVEHVVSITEHVAVATKSFQPIQIENPQFFRFQLVLAFGHSIETLRHINMFLEQVAQNASTWSKTLQELSNLRVEFEQVKENMSKTHNHVQTSSLELK